jgi:hypothetical protein
VAGRSGFDCLSFHSNFRTVPCSNVFLLQSPMAPNADSSDSDVPTTGQGSAAGKAGKASSEPESFENKAQKEGLILASDEEEFEIEAILESKRGIFPKVRLILGMFWDAMSVLTYQRDAGSNGLLCQLERLPSIRKLLDIRGRRWVVIRAYLPRSRHLLTDVCLFSNAQDLIDEFWRKKKGEKKGRKSLEPKGAAKAPKSKRETNESASAPVKKRGRDSGAMNISDDSADDREPPSKKRSRNGAKASSSKGKSVTSPSPITVDEDMPVGDMKKYLAIPSWEHIVAHVDTVERTDGGLLEVYFTLCACLLMS